MNNNIIYLGLLCCLLISCGQSDVPTTAIEEASNSSTTAVDLLAKNDQIKIGNIQKRNIAPTIHCTGIIDIPPTEINSVHSKTSGQLTFLKYLPGDYVTKGTLLAKVENALLVEKQRILLETKINREAAGKDFERKKILKAGQATPQKTFDESQNKYELLSATYKGLRKELELMGINVNKLESETSYQSTVNIYASKSGYIREVLVNRGQMISTATRLMDIANVDHLHLELRVLSKDIGPIVKGQLANFTLPNRPETFQATVERISPMIISGQSTLIVHCHIDHEDKKIFVPGLFVNAIINLESQVVEGLPLNAVVKEGQEFFGYQIHDNIATKTALLNAVATSDFVVFEGNKTGQWVIEGAYYIE